MKEYQAVVTFRCNTEDQAEAVKAKLQTLLGDAEQSALIRDGKVAVREEIVGEIEEFPGKDIEDISVELDYDDIFVPRREPF